MKCLYSSKNQLLGFGFVVSFQLGLLLWVFLFLALESNTGLMIANIT